MWTSGHRVSSRQAWVGSFLAALAMADGLLLQALPDLQGTPPSVDGGANADDRIFTNVSVLCHIDFSFNFSAARRLMMQSYFS